MKLLNLEEKFLYVEQKLVIIADGGNNEKHLFL